MQTLANKLTTIRTFHNGVKACTRQAMAWQAYGALQPLSHACSYTQLALFNAKQAAPAQLAARRSLLQQLSRPMQGLTHPSSAELRSCGQAEHLAVCRGAGRRFLAQAAVAQEEALAAPPEPESVSPEQAPEEVPEQAPEQASGAGSATSLPDILWLDPNGGEPIAEAVSRAKNPVSAEASRSPDQPWRAWPRQSLKLAEERRAKIPQEEMKRLTLIGLQSENILKHGRKGCTPGLIDDLHKRWKRSEVIKLRPNKKRDMVDLNVFMNDIETQSWGLVINRTGNVVIAYRGQDYIPPALARPKPSLPAPPRGIRIDTSIPRKERRRLKLLTMSPDGITADVPGYRPGDQPIGYTGKGAWKMPALFRHQGAPEVRRRPGTVPPGERKPIPLPDPAEQRKGRSKDKDPFAAERKAAFAGHENNLAAFEKEWEQLGSGGGKKSGGPPSVKQ